MSVLNAKIVTTNNNFCKFKTKFKGYICSSIELNEFHVYPHIKFK